MKQRITPTHFIEVWVSNFTNNTCNGGIYPIRCLESNLLSSIDYGIETLFIWKIKCKKL